MDDKDIVHFRQIRVHPEHIHELQERINRVKQGSASDEEILALAGKLAEEKITLEEFHEKSLGNDGEEFKGLTIKKLRSHYYLPVIIGKEAINYIRHIIKVQSEVKFINNLEKWIDAHPVGWDAWMFSKIDEFVDNINLPYYDTTRNEYRRFLPDFVFWMCKGNEYRIVFVDPKGEAHTSAYHKIDGYKKLFEQNSNKSSARQFTYGKHWKVSVSLLMFNPEANPLQKYKRYWSKCPGDIFKRP